MSFLGYVRSDGSVGTRNYVLVIPQGIIAKSICDFVAGTRTILTVDHGSGRTANDREQIARLLIGLGRNPNVASVIVHAASPGVGYPELRAERLADEIAARREAGGATGPRQGRRHVRRHRAGDPARPPDGLGSLQGATGNGERCAPLRRGKVRLLRHDVRDRRQPGGGVPLRQDRRRRGHGAVRGDHRDHRSRGGAGAAGGEPRGCRGSPARRDGPGGAGPGDGSGHPHREPGAVQHQGGDQLLWRKRVWGRSTRREPRRSRGC